MRLRLIALLPLLCAAATPYTPPVEATVLLKRSVDAFRTQRITIPERVGRSIDAQAVAAVIAQARRSGDPRYYGQAQALLGAAWTLPEPAADLRLLRATLRQQRHDFAGAKTDLDAVLSKDPRNAQAHLLRATLALVQGEPARAKTDCAALLGQTTLLVTVTCIAAVGGLTGQAATALNAIEQTLTQQALAPLNVRLWALTQAAEIAERLGNNLRAEAYFRTALAAATSAGENDVYLKAAFADFLLQQRRAEEVRTLLANETAFDPLLLRLALAESGAARRQYAQQLQARFALAATRGDTRHEREQAMAALHLERDPKTALQLAKDNWASQREPADALLLAQAALATRDKAAAQPVADWHKATGIEDVRLQALLAQWHALP